MFNNLQYIWLLAGMCFINPTYSGEVTIFFNEIDTNMNDHMTVEVIFQGFNEAIDSKGNVSKSPQGNIMAQYNAYQSNEYRNGVYTLKYQGNTVEIIGIFAHRNQLQIERSCQRLFCTDQDSIRVNLYTDHMIIESTEDVYNIGVSN